MQIEASMTTPFGSGRQVSCRSVKSSGNLGKLSRTVRQNLLSSSAERSPCIKFWITFLLRRDLPFIKVQVTCRGIPSVPAVFLHFCQRPYRVVAAGRYGWCSQAGVGLLKVSKARFPGWVLFHMRMSRSQDCFNIPLCLFWSVSIDAWPARRRQQWVTCKTWVLCSSIEVELFYKLAGNVRKGSCMSVTHLEGT